MNRKLIFKDLDLSHLVPINWRSNSTYLIQTYNNYISDRILDSVHMCVSNTSGSQVDVCGDILLVAHYCTSILTIEGRGRGYMFWGVMGGSLITKNEERWKLHLPSFHYSTSLVTEWVSPNSHHQDWCTVVIKYISEHDWWSIVR